MESDLIPHIIRAVTVLVGFMIVFGFPALAVVAIRYFRLKERELELEMEHRQRSEQQQLAIENRLQRLEDTLTSSMPANALPAERDLSATADRLK